MQTAGPFRLQRPLSFCDVGDVWSGVDDQGRAVTIAILNERASVDDRWRQAFAAAAEALGEAGADQLPIMDSDHDAPRPWVACNVERGSGAAQIFVALGRRMEQAAPAPDDRTPVMPPVPAQREPEPEPATAPFTADHRVPSYPAPAPSRPDSPSPPAHPLPPQPEVATPSSPAYHPGPSPAEHFSPVSGPHSPAGYPPISADPYPVSGSPETGPRSRIFGDQPPPKPKRDLLRLTAVALVALLVGVAGGVAVMAARDGGEDPAPELTQAAPLTPEQLLLPANSPAAPGVEPPQGGGWPSSWPEFTSSQPTKPITGLPGVGFDFRIPPGWSCTSEGQAAAAVRYRCGQGQGDQASGGELIVRTCEPPCGEARRTELRQLEEAWGLRWTRSGPFTAWARTTEINGKRLYGLVYVAFWRSTPEGRLDRQLVLRMTTPLATSDDLKKVANSIRDSTFTL